MLLAVAGLSILVAMLMISISIVMRISWSSCI